MRLVYALGQSVSKPFLLLISFLRQFRFSFFFVDSFLQPHQLLKNYLLLALQLIYLMIRQYQFDLQLFIFFQLQNYVSA